MANLMNYSLRKRKSNLPKVSPYISLRDLEIFRLETANLQKAFEGMSRNAALTSRSFQDVVSDMEQWARHMGTLSSRFIIEDNLGITMLEIVIGKGPRYNNPDKDITGLGKQFIIFNHDALEMYRSVFICEGALNALTLGDRAIATMGKAISQYQVNELLKSQCQRYIILLDPDARSYAVNLALKLVAYKKVKVVFLPEGFDVNDLGKKQTLKLVYQTRYQSYQELIQIRNSLE